MKKLFLAFFMAVATVSFMTGCDKENDDELTDGTEQTDGTDSEEPGGDETEEPATPANPMVGVWECTSGYEGYGNPMPYDPGTWVITLNEDGTYNEEYWGDDLEGTWSYDEETMTLIMMEDGYYESKYVISFTDETSARWSQTWGSYYDFTKK